jgi:glycosyltransferase involved in cell wall biosynthesis
VDVAVIIPAFNAGPYLDQTLASVAGQTCPPAAVVVADDRSEDDTAERARRWRGRLPIEVLRLERNAGPGPARDRAIQVADASLLAILDADDLLLPDHLEVMAAAHQRAPGLVSAQELSWAPGRGPDLARRRVRPAPVPTDPQAQLAALLQRNYVNFPLFSRELYQASGGFRERFRVGEDWDLWIRMLRAGARITETSHPTALHRVRPRSLSVDPRRTVELGIDVLTTAVAESRSAGERAAAERGLQALLARKRYYDASALAAAGHAWRARATAVRGRRSGGWRVTAGLTALTLAPRISIRLEQATRNYRVFRPQ